MSVETLRSASKSRTNWISQGLAESVRWPSEVRVLRPRRFSIVRSPKMGAHSLRCRAGSRAHF
eukprot:6871542-Pyramimonas_sp.AAC.1